MKALTEKEAASKHCPMISATCIGSRCMMWKWISQEFIRKTELWSKSRNVKVSSAFIDDAEWRPVAGEPDEPPSPVGHCAFIKTSTWSY